MFSLPKSRSLKLVLISAVLVLGLIMHLTTAPPADAAKRRVTFGTGGIGGTWYPCGAGLAELWNKEIPEITVTVGGSAGSVVNAKQLSSKKVDLAFTVMDTYMGAMEGTGSFRKKYDLSHIRSMMIQHLSPSHIAVLKKSDIHGIKDLKGKRISISAKGDSTNQRALWLLEAVGIKRSEVKLEYIGDQQAADALADGRIDMMIEFVGWPNSSYLNLATTRDIRFLQLTKPEEKRFRELVPFMMPQTIPAGTYRGQDKAMVGYGIPGVTRVQKDFPADIVYKMLKAVDGNWEFLYKVHRAFRQWQFHPEIESISQQKLHPGALKFYKEKGIIK